MKLKEPYGLVLDSLGKPSSNVPFMMPKRDRRHRSVQADRQPGRLRPVHLRQGRVQARREARLHQEPQVQAAAGARLGPGRRQGRQGRPRRVRRHARPDAAGERADRGRDRHDRERAARSHAVAEGRQERADRQLEPARPAVRHPLQPPDQAVRQSQDPPGRAPCDAPGGLPQGDGGRAASTTRSAPPPSSAARPTAWRSRATCWSSPTSRSPRRSSRKRATTARPWC